MVSAQEVPLRPPLRRLDDADVARATALLEQVCDPEIPVITIADLGVLRAVARDGQTIVVTLTPTYSGCPAMEAIADDCRDALRGDGIDCRIKFSLNPPWTTDWLTPAGKEKLRDYGIAPPLPRRAVSDDLFAEDALPPCPHCGSANTRLISEFGSTACKALHTCGDCSQPFDYFKCL